MRIFLLMTVIGIFSTDLSKHHKLIQVIHIRLHRWLDSLACTSEHSIFLPIRFLLFCHLCCSPLVLICSNHHVVSLSSSSWPCFVVDLKCVRLWSWFRCKRDQVAHSRRHNQQQATKTGICRASRRGGRGRTQTSAPIGGDDLEWMTTLGPFFVTYPSLSMSTAVQVAAVPSTLSIAAFTSPLPSLDVPPPLLGGGCPIIRLFTIMLLWLLLLLNATPPPLMRSASAWRLPPLLLPLWAAIVWLLLPTAPPSWVEPARKLPLPPLFLLLVMLLLKMMLFFLLSPIDPLLLFPLFPGFDLSPAPPPPCRPPAAGLSSSSPGNVRKEDGESILR